MGYIKNDPVWSEGGAPGISAERLNHLETQYAEAIASMVAKLKAGSVTDTTGADGKIAVTFAEAFASTPIVVVTLFGDVDYYPVITAKSTTGFTVKILRTYHKHSQGNTNSTGSHTHTNSSTGYKDLGNHRHSQGVTGETYAAMKTSEVMQYPTSLGTKYCAGTSGGSPTSAFLAMAAYQVTSGVLATHVHTNPDTNFENLGSHRHTVASTGSAGSHSHTNPDTTEINAGNLLATTEVTFSYIAMIP